MLKVEAEKARMLEVKPKKSDPNKCLPPQGLGIGEAEVEQELEAS